eukprot:gene174-63_t
MDDAMLKVELEASALPGLLDTAVLPNFDAISYADLDNPNVGSIPPNDPATAFLLSDGGATGLDGTGESVASTGLLGSPGNSVAGSASGGTAGMSVKERMELMQAKALRHAGYGDPIEDESVVDSSLAGDAAVRMQQMQLLAEAKQTHEHVSVQGGSGMSIDGTPLEQDDAANCFLLDGVPLDAIGELETGDGDTLQALDGGMMMPGQVPFGGGGMMSFGLDGASVTLGDGVGGLYAGTTAAVDTNAAPLGAGGVNNGLVAGDLYYGNVMSQQPWTGHDGGGAAGEPGMEGMNMNPFAANFVAPATTQSAAASTMGALMEGNFG